MKEKIEHIITTVIMALIVFAAGAGL